MNYEEFLRSKAQWGGDSGFKPLWIPNFLFDFQKELAAWAIRRGRCAIFADCGLGKTPIFLVWAQNVVEHTNGRVLIVTPLAVSHQTIREGNKFGIDVIRSDDGTPKGRITVTNYERLHLFNPNDYTAMVGDESSILKNFDGKRRGVITEFMRQMPYRLLCTATAAPNDYIEFGTTSEALSELGYMDMLNRFFKNEQNTADTKRHWSTTGGGAPKWRFKKHAEVPFWRWICSWARALRRPSDLGFDDGPFILPELIERQSVIEHERPLDGQLFAMPVRGLKEQRDELRITLEDRCERAADLVRNNGVAVMWCHLNDEGDLLEKLIPDAIQVSGSDSDDKKESVLGAFSEGNVRVLITKPKIAGFGLNWQHCAHMTFFPSHSFEQYYQSVRRCWRFGQSRPVTVDIITTKGGESVLQNMQRKAAAADKMFTQLVSYVSESMNIATVREYPEKVEVPAWV